MEITFRKSLNGIAKCTVDNCENSNFSKGLCTKHYQSQYYKNNKKGPDKKLNKCIIDGCDGVVSSRGFCQKHYYQNNKETIKDYSNNYHKKHKEVIRNKALIKLYTITIEQYNELLQKQDGKCAICGKHHSEFKVALSVDHDHNCCHGRESCGKCIRGLLCASCNRGIGHFSDDSTMLKIAVDYIDNFKN